MTRSLLRRLADRPLTERERQRAFSLAALTLLLVAALLTVTARRDEHVPLMPRTSTATAVTPPPPAPAEPAPTRTPAPAPRAVRAPKAVIALARRALSDYLAYLYGQRSARGIEGLDRALRRRLAADRPRVPAAVRRRRPGVGAMTGTRVPDSPSTWAVRARVVDGAVADFPAELLIARRGGRLVVIQIGGE